MSTSRLVLVDDSLIVRRLLRESFQNDQVLDVVGSAANGPLALQRVTELDAEVVVLDLSGRVGVLETVLGLREAVPSVRIVVYTDPARDNAPTEQQSLDAGALFWLAKPKGGDVEALRGHIRSHLVPLARKAAAARSPGGRARRARAARATTSLQNSTLKRARVELRNLRHDVAGGTAVKEAETGRPSPRSREASNRPEPRPSAGQTRARAERRERPTRAPAARSEARAPVPVARRSVANAPPVKAADLTRREMKERRAAAARVDMVVIGVSTGGPNALAVVLAKLPADLPVPVVIVQHMPETFTSLLAERLNKLCPLDVAEAADGEVVQPGTIRIAKGGIHLILHDKRRPRLMFDDGPPENSCKPAVDVLFRSAAKMYRQHVLGVVLTGMGADGALGAGVLREYGAQVVAQDEASSVVWGMPGAVVQMGQADAILPLDAIAGEIVDRTRRK